MKIGIDCRMSGLKHAGIGRYVENLISLLPKFDKKIDWFFFFNSSDQVEDSELLGENFSKQSNVTCIYAQVPHYSLAEQTQLPTIFDQQKLDLLHIPHFNAPIFYQGKTIVTIHDLLWHQYQGLSVTTLKPWAYGFKYLAYRLVTRQAVANATRVLVPAKTVKAQLASYYPQARHKTHVTKEGVAEAFLKSKKLPAKPFSNHLVYVGSLYPHKNLELVLRALQLDKELKLTVVSARNVFWEKIKSLSLSLSIDGQVEFAGFLSDQDLFTLYKKPVALVQPSFSEGFGLTGIEAMSSGVPVLASDIPIFKEVYKDAAAFFNPDSVQSFIKAIKSAKKNQLRLVKNGLKLAKDYQWQNTAQQTLRHYLEVA